MVMAIERLRVGLGVVQRIAHFPSESNTLRTCSILCRLGACEKESDREFRLYCSDR